MKGEEVTMNKLNVIILPVFLLLLLAAGTAYAQDSATVLKGDVPFDFIVADKTLPIGTYTVKEFSAGLTKIQNMESHDVVVVPTVETKNGKQVKPMFVFRRYGEQYYLGQIWNGSTDGRILPKSDKEVQVAKNQAAPQLIYIAAK